MDSILTFDHLLEILGFIIGVVYLWCGKEMKPIPITHAPVWAWMVIVVGAAAIWAVLAWFLENYTDSTVPRIDAFTTALSIVGTWAMARKYAEQACMPIRV